MDQTKIVRQPQIRAIPGMFTITKQTPLPFPASLQLQYKQTQTETHVILGMSSPNIRT